MSLMSRRTVVTVATVVIAVAASIGPISTAFAQSAGAPDVSGATTKAQKRAANKQARKAHRAVKNAELSKLEKAGYNPGTNDPSYPANLEAAQKKAGIQ